MLVLAKTDLTLSQAITVKGSRLNRGIMYNDAESLPKKFIFASILKHPDETKLQEKESAAKYY